MELQSGIYSIYKRTIITTLILGTFFVILTFCYVFYAYPSSTVRNNGVQELGQGSIEAMVQGEDFVDHAEAVVSETDSSIGLFLNANSSESEYLWIPVSEDISTSDIVIENHYMDRQLWISIAGMSSDFYKDAYISGNLEGISNGTAQELESQVILKFSLDDVYEFNTIFENNVLYVEKVSPREVYDRIVIIDPDGDVPEELLGEESLTPDAICVDIAGKLQTLLEAEGIRVYVTNMDQRELDDADSIGLAMAVKPDMLVRIETAYDEDSKVYGTQTVYNGTYFIPGFGSAELADMIEAQVTTAIGGRASGLVEAGDEDQVILHSTVPAAAVKVGYYTNMQENILLNRDDYRGRIAQGLYDAVMQAYGD